jgi:hypothetical protein
MVDSKGQSIEGAVIFFRKAIRAADLIVIDQVVISIGAAVSSANAKINPLIVHLQHNSDEIKLSLSRPARSSSKRRSTLTGICAFTMY